MIRWGKIAAAYAVLCAVALALTWPRGSPLRHPQPSASAALLGEGSAHLLSLGLGVAFGLLVILSSRLTVQRYDWARRLHLELRPFARSLTPTGVVVLALLSSAGEIEHAIASPDVQRFPFQLEWVVNQYFEIDKYQPLLFFTRGFEDLFARVDELERWVRAGRLYNVSPGEPAINERDLASFLEAAT